MNKSFKRRRFEGPLFIVGFGRSGTKMLRSILNQNKKISIPDIESNFLPMWIMQESKYGDLSVKENFKKFYSNAMLEPFFSYMKQKNDVISFYDWYNGCRKYEVSELFEVLIKYYSNGQIWGDKSPVNTRYLSLIKGKFPHSKFIHIVRDVRDCCASAKKAWNSNVFRTAQRWADSVKTIKKASFDISEDYLEIKYENLIENPESEIRKACRFLSIEYDKNMLRFDTPPEQYGYAAGMTHIMSSNKNKYHTRLTRRQISGIEKISCESMKIYGYLCDYNGESQKLSQLKMGIYRIQDGVHHVLRNIKERGLADAITFTWKFFRLNTIIGN